MYNIINRQEGFHMKKLLCLFLVSIFVCSVGCRGFEEEVKFDIKNDYIELKEYYNYGDDPEDPYLEYIGKDLNELSHLINIKSMSNLPAEDYVCKIEAKLGIVERYYMKKDAEEPILRYDVYEIWIYTGLKEIPKLLLTDKEIINALLTVRREEEPLSKEKKHQVSTNTFKENAYCILDLKQFSKKYGLSLIYVCKFDFDDPEHIQWTCIDSKDDCLYTYDVTEILSDYYNKHKNILTSSS